MNKQSIFLTGGLYNRRKIVSYSKNTKPASQMVRLAVFNSLYEVKGVVLDLFAGSGAYAFESLSRGASLAYLNDNDLFSLKSIKENANYLSLTDKVKINSFDYLKALEYYTNNKIFFDYCFIDPPYDFSDQKVLEILTILAASQNSEVKIVVERHKSAKPLEVENLKLLKNKKYGNKQIFIYEKI